MKSENEVDVNCSKAFGIVPILNYSLFKTYRAVATG